jgi:three-Cys-motif partner protein
MSKKPDGKVGPWAKEKLAALGQYLEFYTTALKNQSWLKGTAFVDGFAGPGLSPVRTKDKGTNEATLFGPPDQAEVEYLKGSPRVALDIQTPFSSYVFIERAADRIAELKTLEEEYRGKRKIDIRQGDANTEILNWLKSHPDWKAYRAVVFLDPFGMQLPWSTIEALAATKAIEVIINFPLDMAIQRTLTKSAKIPETWQKRLDALFGSSEWRQLVYEETNDLFGARPAKRKDSGDRLLEWYRGRLKKAFGHVSTARLIKNTRGNPLYYLIWAGPHKLGMKGAEYVLGKGEGAKKA